MILCKDIIKKSVLSSYFEFFLVMCLAAECHRLGLSLDMSGIGITDPELLCNNDKDYKKFLESVGAINYGTVVDIVPVDSDKYKNLEKPEYFFDTTQITALEGKIFRDDGDEFYWEHNWAYTTYGPECAKMLNPKNTGNLLLHLTAYYIIGRILGRVDAKPILLDFNRHDSKSSGLFLPAYACAQSMKELGDMIEFRFEDEDETLDLKILYRQAMNAGRYAKHSVVKKEEAMRKYGIGVGSVVVVYERGKISTSNAVGKIKGAIIGIVRGYDTKTRCLEMKMVALNKTKEEVEIDYYSIEPEYRYNFMDLLSFKVASHRETLPLYNVGVCDYFYDEGTLLGLLDPSERVVKTVTTSDRGTIDMDMSSIDAIYWMLREYEIEFDAELYKKMYSDGQMLLWDKIGAQPAPVKVYEEDW